MVRVVDCHAGFLGLNPGGPTRFSPWNYFRYLGGGGGGQRSCGTQIQDGCLLQCKFKR